MRAVAWVVVAVMLGTVANAEPARAQDAAIGEGVGRAQPALPAAPGERPSRAHPPAFDPRRYTEDYLYLRDPEQRSGAWWEKPKYLPLDRNEDVVLGLGNEVRVRAEGYRNALFSPAPDADQAYVWTRVLPYADLHVGPHLRAFAQLEAAYSDGQKPGPSPLDRTGIELLQGFVELSAPVGGGRVSARIGRQVVSYGDGSLIDSRYGPNVLQSFDGVFAGYVKGSWRGDLFWARPVVSGLRDFDDRTDRSQQIWGAIVGRDLPGVRGGVADIAYVGFQSDRGRWAGRSGTETRHSIALRFGGAVGRLDGKAEAIGQFGRFGGGPVSAYALAGEVGYRLPDLPLTPRLHVNAGIASGDHDPAKPGSRTFNALFPRGQYFSDTGLIGPYNLVNARFGAQINPTAKLRLDGLVGFYWRESESDAVYRNGGGILFPASAISGRFIARQYEMTADWSVTRGIDLRLTLAAFDRGAAIRSIPGSRPVRFAGLETRIWF